MTYIQRIKEILRHPDVTMAIAPRSSTDPAKEGMRGRGTGRVRRGRARRTRWRWRRCQMVAGSDGMDADSGSRSRSSSGGSSETRGSTGMASAVPGGRLGAPGTEGEDRNASTEEIERRRRMAGGEEDEDRVIDSWPSGSIPSRIRTRPTRRSSRTSERSTGRRGTATFVGGRRLGFRSLGNRGRKSSRE
jgi:hypothetical protein